jgi:hypothetical protein
LNFLLAWLGLGWFFNHQTLLISFNPQNSSEFYIQPPLLEVPRTSEFRFLSRAPTPERNSANSVPMQGTPGEG